MVIDLVSLEMTACGAVIMTGFAIRDRPNTMATMVLRTALDGLLPNLELRKNQVIDLDIRQDVFREGVGCYTIDEDA